MIDTHTHLYLPEFQDDIDEVVARAAGAGLHCCWLPAIDADSLDSMHQLDQRFPGFFHLFAGLHPTEINDDYKEQLARIYQALQTGRYKGIGEIGMDLYWDSSRQAQQEEVLRTQLDWAVEMDLPVLLHVRNAFDETLAIVRDYYDTSLRGVFHCFSGNFEQAQELVEQGFYLGIGGTITYKNSSQRSFISRIPLSSILVETDAPYLSPVPFRGKRNESAYVARVVETLAELYALDVNFVAKQTEENANCLENQKKPK